MSARDKEREREKAEEAQVVTAFEGYWRFANWYFVWTGKLGDLQMRSAASMKERGERCSEHMIGGKCSAASHNSQLQSVLRFGGA